jgi:predicted DNA-binding transcriptional regulator AlpA
MPEIATAPEAPPLRVILGREVAQMLRTDMRTLRGWVRAGTFPPPLPLGPRRWRWDAAVVMNHLRRCGGSASA